MNTEQKNNKENKTPTLYTYYGKQYDFNDLRKDADLGFSDYLQTLKRGDKDSEELWNAYSNIMSGIGDGTITFEGGRFSDSLGRYQNGVYYDNEGKRQTSKRKSKDYYGLVANYIASKLGKSKEYQAQEEGDKNKIKWEGSKSLSKAFNRRMFNSDNGNIADFIDLDPYDTETNTRHTTNRVRQSRDVMQYLYNNFDNLFTGYSDSDSYQAKQYLKGAIDSLSDDSADSQDYLALSRAFGGINWRNMFSNGLPESQNQTATPSVSDFVTWRQTNYPVFSGSLSPARTIKSGTNLNTQSLNKFRQAMSKVTNQGLTRMISSAINDPNYKFDSEAFLQGELGINNYNFGNSFGITEALNALKSRNALVSFGQSNPNLYYIPGTENKDRNTAWVWDSVNNTLNEMRYDDIPYWVQKIQSEYNTYSGNSSGMANYYKSKGYVFQDGGVLKAQGGVKLWYDGLQDFDPAKYKYSYDTSRLVNGDMSDDVFDPWISNIHGSVAGRYKPSQGNTREYTQGIENQNYYKTFGNSLFNPDGSFTSIGEAWAKAVDANLPSGSTASFYDNNGNLRTSWTVTNNDVYGRTPRTFNNLQDYVNYVRNDQILGSRHNVFLNTGNRYFYTDQNGQKHWVDPSLISKYKISNNPAQEGWNSDNTIYWKDYELTGLADNNPLNNIEKPIFSIQEPTKTDKPLDKIYPRTNVNPVSEQGASSGEEMYNDKWLEIFPELINTGRLAASLITNRKVTDTLMRSLKPVLKTTYERYSPVTGAFGEMQFRNRQAANLRRQAARPFTSDASLQLAGTLDADRQARDLEYQGFLADDKEIKRTREAALARQEDNMARRSEVANFNRASINQTNRERDQLRATKLRRNWQSVDNFMQGMESRLSRRIAESRANRQNASVQVAQSQYQNYIQQVNNEYMSKHPGATTQQMLNDPEYTSKIQRLKRRYQYDMYNISRGMYLQNPYSSEPETYDQILNSKNGGRLRPSTMYLINKVIKNESNS